MAYVRGRYIGVAGGDANPGVSGVLRISSMKPAWAISWREFAPRDTSSDRSLSNRGWAVARQQWS